MNYFYFLQEAVQNDFIPFSEISKSKRFAPRATDIDRQKISELKPIMRKIDSRFSDYYYTFVLRVVRKMISGQQMYPRDYPAIVLQYVKDMKDGKLPQLEAGSKVRCRFIAGVLF